MEKVLKFLKNRWFLLGISFLSILYVLFLGKLIQATFTCYLETENFNSAFALYLLINFLFGVLMFFTRKQIPTVICAIIVPFEAFVLMITAFGMWYIIIPPIAVGAVIFLSCRVGESCKTVLGTVFLLMFIVGGLVYSVFLNFGISLNYVITENEVDASQRNTDYLMSPDGTYRLVEYIDANDSRTIASYYVEEAYRDEEYPFVVCRRVFGCKRVLASIHSTEVEPRWISDTVLYIDGRQRDMEELFGEDDEAETDAASKTERTEE